MRFTRLTMLFLTVCLSFGFLSCDKNNDYYNNPTTIKVLSVEAGTNFDLSARSNWLFYTGGLRYRFTVNEGKLFATPDKAGAAEFTVTSTDKNGKMFFKFGPENYGKTRDESSIIKANLRDQSTSDKFIRCDLMAADYSGLAKEDLTELKLYHQNALLTFRTANVPEDAKVFIGQLYDQKITPLQDQNDPNAYKAIVFPENLPERVYVIIESGEQVYTQTLKQLGTRMPAYHPYEGLGTSALVSFTAEIDENNKLVIKDFERKSMVYDWPIDR